jgi:hypothetical protein
VIRDVCYRPLREVYTSRFRLYTWSAIVKGYKAGCVSVRKGKRGDQRRSFFSFFFSMIISFRSSKRQKNDERTTTNKQANRREEGGMNYRRTPISFRYRYRCLPSTDQVTSPTEVQLEGGLDRLDIVFCLEDQEGLVRDHRASQKDLSLRIWADLSRSYDTRTSCSTQSRLSICDHLELTFRPHCLLSHISF